MCWLNHPLGSRLARTRGPIFLVNSKAWLVVEVMTDLHSYAEDNKRSTSTLARLLRVLPEQSPCNFLLGLWSHIFYQLLCSRHDKDLGENCSFQGVPSMPLSKQSRKAWFTTCPHEDLVQWCRAPSRVSWSEHPNSRVCSWTELGRHRRLLRSFKETLNAEARVSNTGN